MKNTNSVKVVAFPSTVDFKTAFENKMVEVINGDLPKPIKTSLSAITSVTQGKVIGLIKEEQRGVHFTTVSEIEISMYRDDDTIDTLFDRLMKADEEIDARQAAKEAEDTPTCYCPACTVNRVHQARANGATVEQINEIVDEAANKFIDRMFGEEPKAEEYKLTESQQAALDMVDKLRKENQVNVQSLAGMGVASMLQGIMEERKEQRTELKRETYGMRQVLESVQNAGVKKAIDAATVLRTRLRQREECACNNCKQHVKPQLPVLNGMSKAIDILTNQGINALSKHVDENEKKIQELKMKINAPVQSATLENGITIHAASRLKADDKVETKSDEVNQDDTKPSDSRLEDLPADMPDELKTLLGAFMGSGAEVRVVKL